MFNIYNIKITYFYRYNKNAIYILYMIVFITNKCYKIWCKNNILLYYKNNLRSYSMNIGLSSRAAY